MARAPWLQLGSPGPSQTLFPHWLQPSLPMAVSDVSFSKAIYSWHRNTSTARAGASEEGSQLKNRSVSPSASLTVPAGCSAPVHTPGWQAALFIPFVSYPCPAGSLSIHPAGPPFLSSLLFQNSAAQAGAAPRAEPLQLNLHFKPTPWARFIRLSTNLGYFVMPQSSCGAREVLVVPQTCGNWVLPVLLWGLGMLW